MADDRAYARRLHVNERPGSLNGDCLFDEPPTFSIASITFEVATWSTMPFWTYVLEPLERNLQPIWAGREIREHVRPVRVREIVSRVSRVDLYRGDVGSLYDGAVLIGHPSTELCRRDLGEGGRAGEEQTRGAETETSQGVFHNSLRR